MILSERQEKVLEFVKIAHGMQVRKYTGEPYWTHCVAVAELASKYHERVIEIALLHDVLEDTDYIVQDIIEALRGAEYYESEIAYILDGVVSLTDVYTKERFQTLNRGKRKLLEAQRLGGIKPSYQNVKLADLIDNTQSIVQNDKDFAKVYLKEKVEILDNMRNGNINLFIECCYRLKFALNNI